MALFVIHGEVFGWSALLVPRLVFACAMVVLFAIDLEHQLLPNVITLPGIVVGLIASAVLPPGLVDALIGVLIGGGVLWLIGEAYFRYSGHEGMGGGDVKMLAMIGAFLGWKLVLVTLVLSSIAGSRDWAARHRHSEGRDEVRAAVRDVPRARRAGRVARRRCDRELVCGLVLIVELLNAELIFQSALDTQRSTMALHDQGRHASPSPHRDRRGAGGHPRLCGQQVLCGGARGNESGTRRGSGNGVHGGGDGRGAAEDAHAGARDAGPRRSVRALERRNHRQHDVRPARGQPGRHGAHVESGRTTASRSSRFRLDAQLPRSPRRCRAACRCHPRMPDRPPAYRPPHGADGSRRRRLPSGDHRFADQGRRGARARGDLPVQRPERGGRPRGSTALEGQPGAPWRTDRWHCPRISEWAGNHTRIQPVAGPRTASCRFQAVRSGHPRGDRGARTGRHEFSQFCQARRACFSLRWTSASWRRRRPRRFAGKLVPAAAT